MAKLCVTSARLTGQTVSDGARKLVESVLYAFLLFFPPQELVDADGREDRQTLSSAASLPLASGLLATSVSDDDVCADVRSDDDDPRHTGRV